MGAAPFVTAAESCPRIIRAKNFLQVEQVQHIKANCFKETQWEGRYQQADRSIFSGLRK